MSLFTVRMGVRLTPEQLADIHHVVEHSKYKGYVRQYQDFSHFVRCAINKLLREEKEVLKSGM